MRNLIAVSAAVVLTLAGCTSRQPAPNSTQAGGASVALVGAGSTFVYPFFSRAFDAYRKIAPNVSINYASIGSGGGIQQFSSQTIDFGATDVPMSVTELSGAKGGEVLQIPVALGGVAIVYNVPSSPQHMVLSPGVFAGIYLGSIADWSDPAIAKLNPGVKLPSMPIVVVHRADGSGTTYMVTDYLSSVSADWKSKVGKSKTVKWPAPSAIGVKGNEGVAGQVKNTPGAIGYVELAYAIQTNMSYAALQNKTGAAIVPSIASVKAAAASVPDVSASKFSIVNAAGKDAYPIGGYTWALLYRHYTDASKQAALCNLFHWLETDGQKLAPQIDYVDLPQAVSARAIAALDCQ